MRTLNEDDLAERDEWRHEARMEARETRRRHKCQCGDDLPGHCPGPMSCPYSDYNSGDETEPDEPNK